MSGKVPLNGAEEKDAFPAPACAYEPFMAERFPDYLDHAASYAPTKLTATTNGTILTRRNAERCPGGDDPPHTTHHLGALST